MSQLVCVEEGKIGKVLRAGKRKPGDEDEVKKSEDATEWNGNFDEDYAENFMH